MMIASSRRVGSPSPFESRPLRSRAGPFKPRVLSHRRAISLTSASASSFAESKVVDVAVIGGCDTGLWAAWKLARAGKRVVVVDIDNRPASASLSPLLIPSSSPLVTHLADEGAEMWRSLGASTGRELLFECGALEVELPYRGDDPRLRECQERGMLRFDRLEDACRQAGVEHSILSADKVLQEWGSLRLPPGSRALHQRSSGVLLGSTASDALRSIAARDGVALQPGVLQGYRDAGGYFQLRTGLRQSESVLVEAEQLLLVPSPNQAETLLAMFGVRSASLTPAYVEHGFLPAVSDTERIPLIRAGTAEAAAAAALAGDEEAKAGDEEEEKELTGEQEARSLIYPRLSGVGQIRVSSWPEALPEGEREPLKLGASASEEEEFELGNEGEEEEEEAAPRGAALHRAAQLASSLIRGVDGSEPPASLRTLRCIMAADGGPLLGNCPGWEDGQVLVALAPTRDDGGGGPQIGGSLGSMAAQMLMGVGLEVSVGAANLRSMELTREALGTKALELGIDPWEELDTLAETWDRRHRDQVARRQLRQQQRQQQRHSEPARKYFGL